MAIRSSWKGNLSFKMMGVQAKFYTATTDRETIKTHLYHKDCLSRVRQFYKCEGCGSEITDKTTQLISGYDLSGKLVELTDEEIQSASRERTSKVDVFRFVNPDKIGVVYYDKPYYVIPDKGNEDVFSLWVKAMERTAKIGVGKMVMSKKEILTAISPYQGIMVGRSVHFSEEVKAIAELGKIVEAVQKVKVDEETLNLAIQLIDLLSGDFDIESFHDEYQEVLRGIIESKSKGELVKPIEAEAKPQAKIVSLAEQLKASIEMAKAVNF